MILQNKHKHRKRSLVYKIGSQLKILICNRVSAMRHLFPHKKVIASKNATIMYSPTQIVVSDAVKSDLGNAHKIKLKQEFRLSL